MSQPAGAPDTIVLVHGFWVTRAAGSTGSTTTRRAGFRVLAPAYPGFEVEVEALNADPSPIEALTVPAIIEHFESVIGELESPPILIGHSAGGAFTQILLDHGFGAAGRRDQLGAHRGRRRRPALAGQGDASRCSRTPPTATAPSASPSSSGTTRSPTPSARSSRARSTSATTSPRPGSIFWGSALANIHPGHDDTYVDYHNDDRAPLLFISGSDDHLMPPKIQRSNAKHYKSDTVTEVKEFEGPHLLPAADGWEEVADYALDWALEPRDAGERHAARDATSASPTSAARPC